MECKNTVCKNQINKGVVVGIKRDFCEPCQIAAIERVEHWLRHRKSREQSKTRGGS